MILFCYFFLIGAACLAMGIAIGMCIEFTPTRRGDKFTAAHLAETNKMEFKDE